MAKGFDRLNVKSAVKNHNKFDLSCTHLTTMNFGEIIPLWSSETIPGDKFSVNAEVFSRMAPLAKPTYGKVFFNTMSSFVPYFQVCDDAEAFIAGKSTWESDTPNLRWFKASTILQMLTATTFSTSVSSSGRHDDGDGHLVNNSDNSDPQVFDYQYQATNDAILYKRLTAKGKLAVKILNSLGYVIPTFGSINTSSTWYNSDANVIYNALPLLCFAKAYNDWMSQSQRYNTSLLTKVLKYIKHNKAVSGYYSSSGDILSGGLSLILQSIVLCYENDYFTSAWQTPASPLENLDNESFGNVPGGEEGHYSVVDFNNFTGPYMDTDNQIYDTRITQRGLDFLQAFDKWVKRNNYSGSRAVQAVYSRFGIKTDDYRSNYAHVIDVSKQPIQVGDVTAQGAQYIGEGNKHNTEIGDYTGKGIMDKKTSWSFQASDYGMLFVIGWYSVSPMNAYGYDHAVLRHRPFDYYTPEFDGQGAEPISVGEVFTNPLLGPQESGFTRDDKVFGYTERYNDYRFGRDRITGEFRDYHSKGDMNCWHTGRLLTNIYSSTGTALVAQSAAFCTMPQTDSEYNRIFSVTDKDFDKFYVTAQFNVHAVRPMLNLNQVPGLGEGSTSVPRNGTEIS